MQNIPEAQYAQKLFDNGAWAVTDSRVSAAVMSSVNDLLPAATNIPPGSDVDPVWKEHKADTAKSITDVEHLYNHQPTGSSSLVVMDEVYNNEKDEDRMTDFITAINNAVLNVSLTLFGRGLFPNVMPNQGFIVDEWALTALAGRNFGKDFSMTQRCMTIAGYLVLTHAGGNQQHINRDLICIGEGGSDIFRWYNYFARHTNAYYLLKEHRTFFHIRSHEAG